MVTNTSKDDIFKMKDLTFLQVLIDHITEYVLTPIVLAFAFYKTIPLVMDYRQKVVEQKRVGLFFVHCGNIIMAANTFIDAIYLNIHEGENNRRYCKTSGYIWLFWYSMANLVTTWYIDAIRKHIEDPMNNSNKNRNVYMPICISFVISIMHIIILSDHFTLGQTGPFNCGIVNN